LLTYFEKLREELVSQQTMRVRITVFKLTAIGLLGYFAATSFQNNQRLVAITALALAPILAVIFDFNVTGCSVAIKKIGYYIRTEIEPKLDRNRLSRPYETFMGAQVGRTSRQTRLSFNRPFTIITAIANALALPLITWAELSDQGLAESVNDATMMQWVVWDLILVAYLCWLAVIVRYICRATISSDEEDEFNYIDGVPGGRVFVAGQYGAVCMDHRLELGTVMHRKQGDSFPDFSDLEGPHTEHWLVWRLGAEGTPKRRSWNQALCYWFAGTATSLHEARALQ
jgi:hypothetical protein